MPQFKFTENIPSNPITVDAKDGFPVGFMFEFQPAEDRRSITALGTCHPAWNYQGDVVTDLTNTVAWAELQVRLHDPRALQEPLVELG